MLDYKSVLAKFSEHGFALSFFEPRCMQFVITRAITNSHFERINFHHNIRGDKIAAGLELTIVPGRTALKGLGYYRSFIEAAQDKLTGYSSLDSKADRSAFIDRCEKEYFSAIKQFAGDCLTILLDNSKNARNAAAKYLEYHPNVTYTFNINEQVNRILNQQVVCIPNGELCYKQAIALIAQYCGVVEGDPNWLTKRTVYSHKRELMVRVQIMASRIANEPGWEFFRAIA
ncbi:MAG: hypothetical protein SFX18_06915 [Pirellulales bacterium]|nr:hypothetical protein [Pirellulales bacterium]